MATATRKPRVIWAPQPGSQALFLSSPFFETAYEGTRGPGKTDALLMDFAQHVGQGFGPAWRGILFREESTQLEDVIAKSTKWFPQIFSGARFIGQPRNKWVFPDGEELLFRHMRVIRDYWKYHGHEYPWIGWEELTNWPDLKCYDAMKSCCRSSTPGMPRKYRSTMNPWGIGHNVCKARFIDPSPPGVPFESTAGLKCVRIHGHWSENKKLLDADPDYPDRISASASNPEQAKAWLDGSWDIVAGGMFDDVWSDKLVLKPFDIPSSWRIDRSYDWGSARPFSVGWWAESDGTIAPNGKHYPRGTLFRIAEWYGWNGSPNEGLRLTDDEVGRGIKERENEMGYTVKAGPADSMIFAADPGRTSSADAMKKYGARFVEADKRPGSRKKGWEAIRRMMKAAMSGDMEQPHLYVFDTCRQFIRTVPTLPRDDKDIEDVDTDAEDHIGDETRYRVTAQKRGASTEHFRI